MNESVNAKGTVERDSRITIGERLYVEILQT